MPNLAAVVAIGADDFVHFIVLTLFAHFRQLVVETQRQATRFRISKIVTTNAGIQPLHAVEDQTVDRVAGGKRQTAEDVVVQFGESIGMIFNFTRGSQDLQRFVRVLAESGTNKNR